jgi:hypothetical protein
MKIFPFGWDDDPVVEGSDDGGTAIIQPISTVPLKSKK